MPWILYAGPLNRVEVPRWQIGPGSPDGLPGWPRLTPIEVPDEAAQDLMTHPEWRPAPVSAAAGEES